MKKISEDMEPTGRTDSAPLARRFDFNQLKEWEEQIVEWNKEFVNSYAPGTSNFSLIENYIDPIKHLNEFESSGGSLPSQGNPRNEEFKTWWFESVFTPKITVNVTGKQFGYIRLKWNYNLDGSDADGRFDRWHWTIGLPPNSWAESDDARRKHILTHELFHAVSIFMGDEGGMVMSFSRPGIIQPPQGSHERLSGDLSDEFQYPDVSLSNSTTEARRYLTAFHSYYIPKKLLRLRSKSKKTAKVEYDKWVINADELFKEYLEDAQKKADNGDQGFAGYLKNVYKKIEGDSEGAEGGIMYHLAKDNFKEQNYREIYNSLNTVPISWGWGNRREEQRAAIKSFLSARGGTMTSEIMNQLCEDKRRLGDFKWRKASLEEKQKFLRTFEFNPSVLVYLNCKNKEAVIAAINQLALNKPTGGTQDLGKDPYAERSVASATNDLIKLANILDHMGHAKEVDYLDYLIKESGVKGAGARAYDIPIMTKRVMRGADKDYQVEENFISYHDSMDNGVGHITIDRGDGSPPETYFYDPDDMPEELDIEPGEELFAEDYESVIKDDRLIGDGSYMDPNEVLRIIKENKIYNLPDHYVLVASISGHDAQANPIERTTKCVYSSRIYDNDVVEFDGLPFEFDCPKLNK